MTPEQIRKFMQEHFGVTVMGDEALEQILGNADIKRLLDESIVSARQEATRATSMDHGYSHRDDYWKLQKIPEKRVPGLAYDSEGRRMPHVEQFREAAESMMRQNPNIVARATRTGIKIDYLKQPKLYDDKIEFKKL